MATRCLLSACRLKNRLKFAGLGSGSLLPLLPENTASALTVGSQLMCVRYGSFFNKRLGSGSLLPLLPENTASALTVGSQLMCVRYGSFFNKKSAEDIWDSVTGVSSQGRKRGRASRGKLMRKQNLNIGMYIGVGESGMVIPGLNAPIMQGWQLTKLYKPEEKDMTFREKLAKARSEGQRSYRMVKRTPLQRGWSGRTVGGISIGPPDPIEGYTFDGFDSKILVHKRVSTMTRSQGKTDTFWCLAVTGNKNGLVGYAIGKSRDAKGAMRVAKKRAAQKLIYVERYNEHTLYHNFYEKHHKTSVIAKQRPKGYGLVCHRAIKTIAELAGIQDMYCKTEGRVKNYLSITKAFFHGLSNQQTHQELADKLSHNIVEYRGERNNYPIVVASPSSEEKETDFVRDENFDFESYFYGGRVPLQKKKKVPPHYNTKAYKKYLSENHKRRNQRSAQINRMMNGLEPRRNVAKKTAK